MLLQHGARVSFPPQVTWFSRCCGAPAQPEQVAGQRATARAANTGAHILRALWCSHLPAALLSKEPHTQLPSPLLHVSKLARPQWLDPMSADVNGVNIFARTSPCLHWRSLPAAKLEPESPASLSGSLARASAGALLRAVGLVSWTRLSDAPIPAACRHAAGCVAGAASLSGHGAHIHPGSLSLALSECGGHRGRLRPPPPWSLAARGCRQRPRPPAARPGVPASRSGRGPFRAAPAVAHWQPPAGIWHDAGSGACGCVAGPAAAA